MHIIPFKSFWIIVVLLCMVKAGLWVYHGGMKKMSLYGRTMTGLSIMMGIFGFDAMTFRSLDTILGVNNKKVFGILFISSLFVQVIGLWKSEEEKIAKMSRKAKIIYTILIIYSVGFFIKLFFA